MSTTHARIGTFDAPSASLEEVVALFREQVVPAFSTHDGFLGYEAYVDRENGRYVGISLWTSRAALEASGETARWARSAASRLGAVTVGQPQVMELAFDSRFPMATSHE